ncbi:hypothetical protein GCM10020000_71890 [Streptomyces olivoverticillatus]
MPGVSSAMVCRGVTSGSAVCLPGVGSEVCLPGVQAVPGVVTPGVCLPGVPPVPGVVPGAVPGVRPGVEPGVSLPGSVDPGGVEAGGTRGGASDGAPDDEPSEAAGGVFAAVGVGTGNGLVSLLPLLPTVRSNPLSRWYGSTSGMLVIGPFSGGLGTITVTSVLAKPLQRDPV